MSSSVPLPGLSPDQRLALLNLVCAFAWTDLDLDAEEREHVRALCRRLDLGPADLAQVERWLDLPPDTDHMADPGAVPLEHRAAFLTEVRRVILADGYVDPEENLAYRLFRDILAGPGAGPAVSR
jgi:uncharacterized tellurite resistance protein B-like protein